MSPGRQQRGLQRNRPGRRGGEHRRGISQEGRPLGRSLQGLGSPLPVPILAQGPSVGGQPSFPRILAEHQHPGD